MLDKILHAYLEFLSMHCRFARFHLVVLIFDKNYVISHVQTSHF